MRILISGATGLIGTALTARLTADGHHPIRLVRASPAGSDLLWDPAAGSLPGDALDGVDAVVNLAGAGIGDHRWTRGYRAEILASRIGATSTLATAIAETKRPITFLSGSAVGAYGDRGDEVLTERSAPGTGFLADVCRQWEAAATPAGRHGARVVLLRTGIVLASQGGALGKQLPLFKVGLGGKIGSGRQWWSWITIDDHVAAVARLLGADVDGPVNLTAPNPVTNAEFTTVLARVLKRPSFLPIPAFGPKLVLGWQLAEALLLDGQRVMPEVLANDGFHWDQPELAPALRAILGR